MDEGVEVGMVVAWAAAAAGEAAAAEVEAKMGVMGAMSEAVGGTSVVETEVATALGRKKVR